jgi:CRP-like cAMP-binding protein
MSVEKKSYKSGDILFNDGDPSRSLFLIQKGEISIRKKKGSSMIEVGKVKAGQVIGELSFFDGQPRSASGIAVDDVEAMEIPFSTLDKIYAEVPDYMKTIMAAMAERLRKANDTIRQLQKVSS